MRTIILDGQEMTTIEKTHKYLSAQLNFPDYYGENLDALWDILSTVSEPIQIRLINQEKLDFHLGEYAQGLMSVFFEAALANEDLCFELF